jgi:hypothetical protein
MKNDVQVSAVFNSSKAFGMELEMVNIKTDKGEVTLSNEQYEELLRTLDGKRESAFSEEFNGYYPKQSFVWN